VTSGSTPGALLTLIRQGKAMTRSQLVDLTGLARSTVSQRIDDLLANRFLVEVGEAPSTGGRRPALLEFNRDAGVVLVADLGATHSRLAVSDLMADPLAETAAKRDIGAGPEAIIEWVEHEFSRLLDEAGRSRAETMGIGIGLPGPVEFASGRAVLPPIMPGWDGYDVRGRFESDFGVPTLVDNDVNIMALGEWWAMDEPATDFVFIKVGTGIGSGLILGGSLQRGHDGTAGDIGHIQIGDPAVICRCGNPGCLEASAGGGALAAALAEQGYDTRITNDVVALVRDGNHDAIRLVQEAGRLIGAVLATIVNTLNPSVIMIGGDLASVGAELIAKVREVVYRRSTALATRHLAIRPSELGDRAGITGAAAMVIEHVLSPAAVNSALAVSGRAE
jgi:predicted NBD/HSP70 family sugar kinase